MREVADAPVETAYPPVMMATSRSARIVLALALAAAGLAGACASDAPDRITLRAVGGNDEGLRFSDGAVVPGDDGADLTFHQAMVMSLRSPTEASICPRGTFAALADVTDAGADCPGEPTGWMQFVYLDASTVHTLDESSARGLGLVVLDRAHQARHRVRVVGDAYSVEDGASVVLEYERLP